MTPRQLFDRICDALMISGRASSVTINRDWRADTLTVTVEHEPPLVDDDAANALIRAATDFELVEVEFRQAVEIQTGS